jgi:pimeloyl-ACP methyl ester carboxylesterase
VTREDVDLVAAALGARVTVADAVALEIESRGEGRPVLLLPGFGSDASVFVRQLPVLAEQYQVLAINPRGVGLSDAPEAESYEVATSAEDAGKLLGAAGHVVGASLGAAAALELALAQPQRVRSLSLITPFVCANVRLTRVVEAWCAIANVAPPLVLAQALLPWLFSENFLSDPVLCARAANGLSQSLQRVPLATLARQARGLESWDGTRAADLGRITVPTLVLAAGADLLTPDAVELAAAIPGAKLTVIQGAGHAVTLEAPHEVNAALLEHLQAVDGRD